MKIALIGLGPGAEFAPFGDPDWECWGLLWDRALRLHCDALFDMHDMARIISYGGLEVAEDLAGIPIYWQYAPGYAGEALLETYPLQDVIADIGRDWFESSAAYMLALAMQRGADTIGLWGFHMKDSAEYMHQRPNLCWLLGMAEARGIKIVLPDGCELLSYTGKGYPHRYGYRD